MTMLRAYDYLTKLPASFDRAYKKDTNVTSRAKDLIGAQTIPTSRGLPYEDRLNDIKEKEITKARKMLKNSSLSHIEQQEFIRNRVKSELAKHKMSESTKQKFNRMLDNSDFGLYGQDSYKKINELNKLDKEIKQKNIQVDKDLNLLKHLIEQYEQKVIDQGAQKLQERDSSNDANIKSLREQIQMLQEKILILLQNCKLNLENYKYSI